MNKRNALTALVAGAAISLAAVPAVSAAPSNGNAKVPAGIACQQKGIATLKGAGLLPTVAKNGIEVKGIGVVPFRQVLSLHRSNPELFSSPTNVTVILPDGTELAATWCGSAS